MLLTNPTNKNSHHRGALLFLATYFTAAALLLFSPKSDAYEWLFEPNARVDLIFTDNVTLSSERKEADFITRLIPGVYSRFTSRRFESETDFRLRNIIYASNSDRNRTTVLLNTKNTGEVIKDLFFVDGNVMMRQQNQSLLLPQGDDANITGNLQDVQIYTVSPYVRQHFGNLASTEIRYARIFTNSSISNSFFNSQAHTYHVSLISGTDFRTLEWGLNYARQDIDFDRRPDSVKIETGIGNVQYNITRRFGLTGTGGYEDNNFGGAGGEKPKGVRWSAGFVWLPNKRTNLEASFGQRFFGDTYYFKLEHRRRITAIHASYREDLRSAWNILNIDGVGSTLDLLTSLLTAQAPPGTDPADIADAAQILLLELGLPGSLAGPAGFLTNRFFLQKSFESSVGFNTTKNTIVVRGFHQRRTPLDNDNLLLQNTGLLGSQFQTNVKQYGVNGTWSHKISARTRFSMNLLYRHIEFPTLFRKDEEKMLRLVVSRRLSERTFGFLAYRLRDRTSNNPFAEFTENRFTASLAHRF